MPRASPANWKGSDLEKDVARSSSFQAFVLSHIERLPEQPWVGRDSIRENAIVGDQLGSNLSALEDALQKRELVRGERQYLRETLELSTRMLARYTPHGEPVALAHSDDGLLDLRLVGEHVIARCPANVVDVDVDRKSTRLNSSHGYISYAVFCLK